MAYKITNRLSTWIQIDGGETLQHGDSVLISEASEDLKRLERLGAVTIDEVAVAGEAVAPPAAPKGKSKTEIPTVSE
ncbi:hypothetical protein M0R72_07870 [Candidatus Pacearchaeota archaeon]|jgi:hypothetical protein|nr:hypothetical protein [Candidatus Pacearchaeota archaeon]